MTIKHQIQRLAETTITFEEFTGWYDTEMSRVKAEVDLYFTLTKLTALIESISLPTESIERADVTFQEKISPLLNEVVTLQTHLDLQTEAPQTKKLLSPATQFEQQLTLSTPEESSSAPSDPSLMELNPFKRLQRSSEQIMALYKSTEQQQQLLESSRQLIQICRARIEGDGRQIPKKELPSDFKNEYFYSICPINANDIDLLKQLKKVEPQSSKVINQLKVLVCEPFIMKSLETDTLANNHIRVNPARKEEARQARRQWLTDTDKPKLDMVDTILGRPQCLREDLHGLVHMWTAEKESMPPDTAKSFERILKDIDKLLKDEDKKRDLITVNLLVLNVMEKIQNLPMPLAQELKSWPEKYATYMIEQLSATMPWQTTEKAEPQSSQTRDPQPSPSRSPRQPKP
ncbi:MAG: hypothetical protein ACPG5T_02155 [Endozoicomonas sp.]